jgi:hypothetical protein
MTSQTDPRENLAHALAETHLEVQAAEHDYRRHLQDGSQHMESRYPAAKLEQRPDDLDHWAWHREAMAQAVERGGIAPVPEIPFIPVVHPPER